VAPTYWLNEKNGRHLFDSVADAQYQIHSLPALQNLPINAAGAPTTGAGRHRGQAATMSDAVVSHYDIAPMVEIYATTQGRDLGAVSPISRGSPPRMARTSRRARSSPVIGQTAP